MSLEKIFINFLIISHNIILKKKQSQKNFWINNIKVRFLIGMNKKNKIIMKKKTHFIHFNINKKKFK